MNKNLLRAVISVAAMMAVATASTVQAQRQQTPPLIQEPSTAPNDLGLDCSEHIARRVTEPVPGAMVPLRGNSDECRPT
jgi:hypothetical protein